MTTSSKIAGRENDMETDRRSLLKAGAGVVAASLLTSNNNAVAETAVGAGPYEAKAFGASSATSLLKEISIERRALGANDVLLDILYCGVCHSDIHTVRGEWGPAHYPCVPGHEIIGRVRAIGSQVTKFKVGDIGGVGCMVNSCRICEHCEEDLEQYCQRGATFTYDTPDTSTKAGYTQGGYSDKIVVTEHFVIRIPPGVNLAATAPLLCAGITTFSPMRYWKLHEGQRVGIIGMGGMGHVAVKLAVAHKAHVTVFTTSPNKVADAKRLGASEAVLSSDVDAMKQMANHFDLLISTVPETYDMGPFIELLKLDGTLVNVGAMAPLHDIHGLKLALGRRSLAGSIIGGVAETQEVIDFCAARNITADVEMIKPSEINSAYDRVVNKDVRYRFVIDMEAKA
jgi:uncharacterized zinc-type alcohol dehydrogenase-like protein